MGAAISRMTVKAEANVAASLGLVKISIKTLSQSALADSALVSSRRCGLQLRRC